MLYHVIKLIFVSAVTLIICYFLLQDKTCEPKMHKLVYMLIVFDFTVAFNLFKYSDVVIK